jgi:hypothetical protein
LAAGIVASTHKPMMPTCTPALNVSTGATDVRFSYD